MINARRWAPLAAAWAAFGIAQALIRSATSLSLSTLLTALAFDVPLALLWAAWTPAIGVWHGAAARRFRSSTLRVLAHLPLLAALAFVYAATRRTLALMFGSTVTVPLHVTLVYFVDVIVASYLVAAWVALTLDAERARSARARRTSALEAQLAAAQLQYLDQQLKPHFLFNALGAISELAHEAPTKAVRMLQNVTRLLETGATRPEHPLVTLREELAALQPYLEIQRLRFQDWLRIEETSTSDADGALVPQFVLQPLVENAVHHGLTNRTQPGRIAVRAHREHGRLIIEIEDNGVGLSGPSYRDRRGIGLTNVRARLDAMYGVDAHLSLSNEDGDGTTARLDIPYRTMTEDLAVATEPATGPDVQVPHPRVARLRGTRLALALIAAWGVVALFRIQHSVLYLMLRDELTLPAFGSALRFDLVVAVLWLLLSPVVLLILRAIPLRRERAALRAGGHILASVAIAIVHATLTPLLLSGFGGRDWSGPLPELFAWNVAIYAVLLVLWHLRALQRWTDERDALDERLRHELDAARFQRVMLELRPAALLEALHALEALVMRDAERAEGVLADIGDFLRGTLDMMQESHVTLRDEAAAAEAYARVLAAGAAPGVELRVSIPLALMERPVPNGVLRAMLDVAVHERGVPSPVAISVGSESGLLVARLRERPSVAATSHPMERLRAYERRGLLAIDSADTDLAVRILDVDDRAGRHDDDGAHGTNAMALSA